MSTRPIYPFNPSATNPETPIYIKIEPRAGGGVLVVATDKDGSREPQSQILAIDGEGYLHLKGNLNPDLGFPMADSGTIAQN